MNHEERQVEVDELLKKVKDRMHTYLRTVVIMAWISGLSFGIAIGVLGWTLYKRYWP